MDKNTSIHIDTPHALREAAKSALLERLAQQNVTAQNTPTEVPIKDLEDVWSLPFDEDSNTTSVATSETAHAVSASESVLSRRAFFRLPSEDVQVTDAVSPPKRENGVKHKVLAGVAVSIGAIVAVSFVGSNDEALKPEIAIETTVQTQPATTETTTIPTTTIEITTTIPATTIAPTTVVETTIAAPVETVAPVVDPIPESTVPVVVETAPPTTLSLYDALDCSQPTMIVQSGMTFSEIAEHCGMTMDRLQSYNPTIDPNHFITGTKLNLRAGVGGASVSDNPKDCGAIGGVLTVIEKGFMPITYLGSLGLDTATVNKLVYDKGILQKFGLATVIAGTKECLPTRDAIRTIYGV